MESTSNCTVGFWAVHRQEGSLGAINIFHDVQARVRIAHFHHHGVRAGIVALHGMALLGRSVDFRRTIAGGEREHPAQQRA